jgi:hypothetical protein
LLLLLLMMSGGQVIAQDAPVALSLFWPHINSEFFLLFSLHI